MYDFSSCEWYYQYFSSVFPIVPACTRIVKMCILTSSHNLPPKEANEGERKIRGAPLFADRSCYSSLEQRLLSGNRCTAYDTLLWLFGSLPALCWRMGEWVGSLIAYCVGASHY